MAFLLKKPVSSVELHNIEYDIGPFIEGVERYFFTKTIDMSMPGEEGYSWEIYVSRFKNFLEYSSDKKVMWISKGRMKDDIIGLFYGRPLQEIYTYCLKENPALVK